MRRGLTDRGRGFMVALVINGDMAEAGNLES